MDMFIKKGSSIGEKSPGNSSDEQKVKEELNSNELNEYVSQLVDSVHGRCPTPSIMEFITRSK